MAGKIEIRKSGEKFRFVVLNRAGEKLLQSAPFDDKAATKRAATALTRAVTGAEIVDGTKPAAPAAKPATTAKPAAAAKPAAKKTTARARVK